MQHYQTITVEPHVPRRIFLPAGALLGVSDPEGGQPFALGLEEGAALEVVSSTAPSLRAGDLLRRQVEIKADFYTGVALTLRAARSQWVEIGTTASAGLLTPESALRVRLPLALPDGPFADLPLPLASVLAEYRIDGATALTYLVKAGQFIEICRHACRGSGFFRSFRSYLDTGKWGDYAGAKMRFDAVFAGRSCNRKSLRRVGFCRFLNSWTAAIYEDFLGRTDFAFSHVIHSDFPPGRPPAHPRFRRGRKRRRSDRAQPRPRPPARSGQP